MNTAITNRTMGFGAQPFFPPGVDYSTPRAVLPTLQVRHLEPVHAGIAAGECLSERHRIFSRQSSALQEWRSSVWTKRERRRRGAGRLRNCRGRCRV